MENYNHDLKAGDAAISIIDNHRLPDHCLPERINNGVKWQIVYLVSAGYILVIIYMIRFHDQNISLTPS